MIMGRSGCYGKLQRAVGERHSSAPWEGKCPLCDAQYEHYSTSHALVWCSHPDVTGRRTRMLDEVDRLLSASGVRPPVQRAVPPPPGSATPAVFETGRAFPYLRRAGNFLLDGDVDAMRGVPLEEIAEWLGTARTTEAGAPVSVPRDAVVRLLTDVVARLIVDGRRVQRAGREGPCGHWVQGSGSCEGGGRGGRSRRAGWLAMRRVGMGYSQASYCTRVSRDDKSWRGGQ